MRTQLVDGLLAHLLQDGDSLIIEYIIIVYFLFCGLIVVGFFFVGRGYFSWVINTSRGFFGGYFVARLFSAV